MKVLYVKDNEDIGRLFVAPMRLTIGLETVVLLASDGQEAVQFALRAKPDIIFVDEELSVMDGIEATRSLRARDGLCDVPVVMVSAHMDLRDRKERAGDAGARRWMGKPLKPEEVEEAVRSALDPQCLPMSGLAASGGRQG
ncbi:MAG TPA: response regulator [Anaerolineae bacterium]|nr:response regulator [Anaerolineae bacterium]